MRFLLPLLLVFSALLCLLPGCEPKEDILTTDSSAQLEFSADTVLFDTVFAQVGTVSKRLWVYNRNNRAVRVEQVQLADNNPGTYSLIINGDETKAANNLEIRGKDSLLVLVKAVLGPSATVNKPFLVDDELRFRTNGNEQQVKLVAYGQNAYFHGVEEHITRNTTWLKNRPHVIYGFVVVDPGVTLRIQPGTRIYSHAGSGMLVQGRLSINEGINPATELTPNDTATFVRFQGDRLEASYADTPGQWRGIQFAAGSSTNNVVRFTEIKNAGFGLLIYNPLNGPHPKVTAEHTILRNISGAALTFASGGEGFDGAGVLSFSGDFDLRNCLFTNCGEYAIAAYGGTYDLNYCTVANYTPQFQRKSAALSFTNEIVTAQAAQPNITRVTINNSIVWGSIANELFFKNGDQYRPNLIIRNSILRTDDYKAATDAGSKLGFNNNGNQLNVNPKFKRSPENFGDRYDYRLDTLSPASNKGLYNAQVPRDLLYKVRNTSAPDLGAYERVNP
ncbi:hypothetical protein J0X19_20475 [Hymenobacter sp. BT186]|uniref:Right-handed parallel beta-helix repeat-containing protein n=1 Tax=Hymenobacter telluris TaxID=2816474 RepID=A0A939EZI9_9BACT|nr:hypothetical protein [Hymenobacter telluris]MBO0360348.1 hypothetical protein [Hymenobacter telluris]MBW3376375.1 hypothetical protein [Hymenobacter norwichensis]